MIMKSLILLMAHSRDLLLLYVDLETSLTCSDNFALGQLLNSSQEKSENQTSCTVHTHLLQVFFPPYSLFLTLAH
jgi:hypothetical protein